MYSRLKLFSLLCLLFLASTGFSQYSDAYLKCRCGQANFSPATMTQCCGYGVIPPGHSSNECLCTNAATVCDPALGYGVYGKSRGIGLNTGNTVIDTCCVGSTVYTLQTITDGYQVPAAIPNDGSGNPYYCSPQQTATCNNTLSNIINSMPQCPTTGNSVSVGLVCKPSFTPCYVYISPGGYSDASSYSNMTLQYNECYCEYRYSKIACLAY
ncbi:MAG: hypothetical protein FWF35_03215 [Elusimicrobia bacterium]|nr:hypothetical protein [Elusimicrobiota bacterium]